MPSLHRLSQSLVRQNSTSVHKQSGHSSAVWWLVMGLVRSKTSWAPPIAMAGSFIILLWCHSVWCRCEDLTSIASMLRWRWDHSKINACNMHNHTLYWAAYCSSYPVRYYIVTTLLVCEDKNNGDKFYRRKSMRVTDEKLIINKLSPYLGEGFKCC